MSLEDLQLIVVNSPSIMKTIGTDKEILELYKKISTSLKSMKVCFLLTDLENSMIAFSAGDLLKQVRESRQVIAFEDIRNIKVVDVQMGVAREFKKSLEANDAYLFNGDKLEKIRVIE